MRQNLIRFILYSGLMLALIVTTSLGGLFRDFSDVSWWSSDLGGPLLVLIIGFVITYIYRPRKQYTHLIVGVMLMLAWSTWFVSCLPGNESLHIPKTYLHTLTYLPLPLLILALSFGLGDGVIRLFWKHRKETHASEKIGTGLALWLTILICISFFTPLNSTSIGISLGIGSIPFLVYMARALRTKKKKKAQEQIHRTELILWYIMLFLGSCFLLYVIRPVPVGWDDLDTYMRLAKSISDGSKIPEGVGMIGWPLFVSSGFILNGPTQGFVLALMSTFLAGHALYTLLKTQKNTSTIAPVLWVAVLFCIPMVQFLSTIDLKVDMIVLFFGILSLMQLARIHEQYTSKKKTPIWKEFLLLGLLLGISFSIKLTSLYLIIALGVTLGYVFWSWWGCVAIVSAFLSVGGWLDLHTLLQIDILSSDTLFLSITSIICITSLIVVVKKYRTNFLKKGTLFLFLGLGMIIPMMPWIAKNTFELQKYNQTFSVSGLMTGFNGVAFYPDFQAIQETETHKNTQSNTNKNDNTGSTVLRCGTVTSNGDLDRYGFTTCGIGGYLGAPVYTSTQSARNSNLANPSMLFLSIAILLTCFATSRWKLILGMISVVALFIFGDPQSLLWKWGRDWFTYPIFPFGYIIILGAHILFGWFWWQKNQPQIGSIWIILTLTYTYLWIISSYFIPWYGILACALFPLLIHTTKIEKNIKNVFIVILCFVIILGIQNLISQLPFISYKPYKNGEQIELAIISSYSGNLRNVLIGINIDTELYGIGTPSSSEILQPEETFASQKKIYRVGTPLSYYIWNNQTRVFNDFLLENFKQYILNTDHETVGKRLREAKIDLLLVDPHMATIDTSPNKDLQKLYEATILALKGPKTPLIYTDNPCVHFALRDPDMQESDVRKLIGTTYETRKEKTYLSPMEKADRCVFLIQQAREDKTKRDLLPDDLQKISPNRGLSKTIYKKLRGSRFILFSVK